MGQRERVVVTEMETLVGPGHVSSGVRRIAWK